MDFRLFISLISTLFILTSANIPRIPSLEMFSSFGIFKAALIVNDVLETVSEDFRPGSLEENLGLTPGSL